MIAALYVDPRGPYPRMEGVDCWDEARDARLYAGPWPVVAHPPCGPWSSNKHLYRGAEHDCALRAVEQVQRWGGVLEHPATSTLFRALRLPRPGELPDRHGGITVQVEQVAWGHLARKKTLLYIVGVPVATVLAGIRTGGEPTHWCSGRRYGGKPARASDAVPPGVKVLSAQGRRRTPPAFAEWLVALARSVRRAEAA